MDSSFDKSNTIFYNTIKNENILEFDFLDEEDLI